MVLDPNKFLDGGFTSTGCLTGASVVLLKSPEGLASTFLLKKFEEEFPVVELPPKKLEGLLPGAILAEFVEPNREPPLSSILDLSNFERSG